MDRRSIKLLIFDMDGVVLDSEPLHEEARQRMFLQMGIMPDNRLPNPVGKSSSGFWRNVLHTYKIDGDPYVLEKKQYELVAEQIRENHLKPSEGFEDVVRTAQKRGIRIALASSSTRELVDKTLRLLGVEAYFDITVSGDEVARKKPAPDVYIKTLQLAGVEPGEAAAVEDSQAGVISAQSAGIYCYGYKNVTSGNQDISFADHKISSLLDIQL